jgi:hypothetical protein
LVLRPSDCDDGGGAQIVWQEQPSARFMVVGTTEYS